MSTSTFIVAISIITVLLLIPAVIAVLVRWLIKDEDPEVEAAIVEPPMEFNSLKDFWESNVPHLIELRDRIIKAGAAVMIGTVLGSYVVFGRPFGLSIVDVLQKQFLAEGVNLQTIGTAEQFVALMGVALAIGVALSMPVIVYQIVAFFAPGLYPREKRIVYTALPFVTELFLAGLVFGWFFTVPAAIGFLTSNFSGSTSIVIQPSLSDFLETVSHLMLWNGVIFEMPAIIYLLARIGVVSVETLGKTRRYAIVIITIVAAVITPTGDPYNLLLLAVPMYILYEMGIVLARFVPKPREDALVQASSGD